MHIVIIGGGKVGKELASALPAKGHSVVVVEKDPARANLVAALPWQSRSCGFFVVFTSLSPPLPESSCLSGPLKFHNRFTLT